MWIVAKRFRLPANWTIEARWHTSPGVTLFAGLEEAKLWIEGQPGDLKVYIAPDEPKIGLTFGFNDHWYIKEINFEKTVDFL